MYAVHRQYTEEESGRILSGEWLESLLPYRPHGPLFRLLAAMMRGKCPFRMAETAYLAARRLYTGTVKGNDRA